MPRGFKKDNNRTKELLLLIAKCLGAVALAGATGSSMRSNQATKSAISEILKSLDSGKRRSLYELGKRKIIKIETDINGERSLVLTHKGKEVIHRYNLESMQLKKPVAWDKRWHIITYDIPAKKRNSSQAFSRKLHALGLYQFQRSFWISPYDCKEELEFICGVFELELGNQVYYFSTDSVPKEKEVKEFFDL